MGALKFLFLFAVFLVGLAVVFGQGNQGRTKYQLIFFLIRTFNAKNVEYCCDIICTPSYVS